MAYIFGGDTGKSYEDIVRERRMADALMERASSTTTTGIPGAIEQIGTALLARNKDRKTAKKEDAARSDAKSARERLLASLVGGTTAPGGSSIPGVSGISSIDTSPMPSAENEAIGDQAMAAIGQPPQGAPAGLIASESGGNFQARNDVVGSSGRPGHFGRVQFGQDRLDDAKRAGVIPPDMTPEQFLNDPEAQKAAEDWHFSDIRSHISRAGYDTMGLDPEGLVRVAHLGGKGGLDKFVQTQGGYNPADTNGTSLMDYYQGANAERGSPQRNPAQGMESAMAILDNPYAADADRAIAAQFVQRAMQQPEGLTAWQKAQLGLKRQEMDMRRSGEWSPGSSTNVNVGGNVPAPPKGYRNVFDDNGNLVRQEVIPGGPAAQEQEAGITAGREKARGEAQQADAVLNAIGDVRRGLAKSGPLDILPETGIVGGALGAMGLNQEAVDVKNSLQTIQSAEAFGRLQSMRDASPTGGALGAVSERELALLQDSLTSLQQSSSRDQFERNLKEVEDRYKSILAKAQLYDNADEFGFGMNVSVYTPDILQTLPLDALEKLPIEQMNEEQLSVIERRIGG